MKKNAIYLTLLLTAFVLQAQRPITVIPQDNVKLSWGLKNLTVVDGHLYGCSNGVMVGSEMSGGMVYMLRPDTLAHYLGSDFSYVVRNPYDSLLYFSRMDASSGRYGLYVHVKDRGRKNRQVDANSWNMALYHPTFSSDGKMMVFSSQNKVGLGGFDLWCSFWNGKKWTKPLNMGNTINTPGNEVNPVFYGNYLIYSTNLQQNGAAYDFYAVYIKPGSTIDNILFGSYQTQRLPAPINSDSNDIELAVDPSLQFGYWVTNRGGKQELYCFQGRLDGVMLTTTETFVSLCSRARAMNLPPVARTTLTIPPPPRLFVPTSVSWWLRIATTSPLPIYLSTVSWFSTISTNKGSMLSFPTMANVPSHPLPTFLETIPRCISNCLFSANKLPIRCLII